MQTPSDIFGSVTVRRYAGGYYDANGRWTGESYSAFTVVASVQPATPREMMDLEEGDRQKAGMAIWTQTELFTGDEKVGRQPDRFLWEGELWCVHSMNRWAKTPELFHWHGVAVREQLGGATP